MNDPATTLIRRLEAAGYFAAYDLLGDGNFRPYDWEKMAGQLDRGLQDLWRFFLLGSRLPEARLRHLLGQASLNLLRKFNLTQGNNGEMTLGPLALGTYRGTVFFADRGVTPTAYFGDDTKALMGLLPAHEGGRCLCLYSQSSLAVMPLARNTEVEVDFVRGPHDRQVVRANLVLNQARGKHRFRHALTARDKSLYDVIVATCPSALEPPMIKVPRWVAGGRDGLKCVRELLAMGKQRLAEDGRLVTTFLFFAEADSRIMQQKLRHLLAPYGLGYNLFVCSKHLMQPGVPIFNMFFGLITADKPDAADAVARRLMNYIKAKKFEAAYLVKGKFFRRSFAAQQEIIDYSDLYYGSWTF